MMPQINLCSIETINTKDILQAVNQLAQVLDRLLVLEFMREVPETKD